MIKQRIYAIIEKDPKTGCRANIIFCWVLKILIWLNVAAVIMGSVSEFYESHRRLFFVFELFSITFFSIEYLLRLWIAPCKFPSSKRPYVRYVFSFYGVIDLLAILPFFMPFVANVDLRVLRILRIFRLLRILKLARYNKALGMIVTVLKTQKEKLYITMFFMIVLLVLASSIMYFVENSAQPDKFPNIPATMWWAVGALTTVGYGDVYPITNLGRVLGAFIAIIGIGLIAMPSGIISMGLIKEAEREKKEAEARDE